MYHLSMELSDYYSAKDHFIVEDLLDFSSNDAPRLDAAEDNGAFDDAVNGSSTDSSTVTAGNGYGSSVSSHGQHFSADFSQPCEEVAELEWLSNFVEDCFSNKDYHHKPIQFSNMNLNSSSSDQITTQHSAQLTNANASTVPAKTRSKRSRHIPSNWASRLPILSRTTPTPTSSSDSGKNLQSVPMLGNSEDRVRRCLHCGSDKTPQWRMGPMGPKTLCNACGVRYKSGRLVPEYRPAASPTYVVSEHSNSHRKVVELRRQKEMLLQQQQQQQMLFWS